MQQKIEDFINNYRTAVIYNNSLLYDNEIAEEAEHEAKQALLEIFAKQSPPSQNGWIDVKTALPKEGDAVMAFDDRIFMSWYGDSFDSESKLSFHDEYDDIASKVTHWQPLPQPPIKGE